MPAEKDTLTARAARDFVTFDRAVGGAKMRNVCHNLPSRSAEIRRIPRERAGKSSTKCMRAARAIPARGAALSVTGINFSKTGDMDT